MDVLDFALFSTSRHGRRLGEPPVVPLGDRDGPRPIANDNQRTGGRRKAPRAAGLLFRLIPRRARDDGPT